MSLNVTVTQKETGVYTVTMVGSVDSETYSLLETKVTALLTSATKIIIFDMKGVQYISSMGIRIILKAQQTIEQGGGNVMMVNLKPQIKKVFDIVKAFPAQKMFASIAELDNYLAQIQRKEMQEGEPL